jgi:hypothetical protein
MDSEEKSDCLTAYGRLATFRGNKVENVECADFYTVNLSFCEDVRYCLRALWSHAEVHNERLV